MMEDFDLVGEDLDSIFGDGSRPQASAPMMAPEPVAPVYDSTVYPLALADTATATAQPTGLAKPIAGLPVWGWGLIVAGLGVGGYFWYQNRDGVKKNPEDGEGDSSSEPMEQGGWRPSRSAFAEKLERHLSKSGLSGAKVYSDAEDAKKARLKQVSPLVTVVAQGQVPMGDLEKFARREGLKPVAHEGGVVGFYPISGKRGRAWEQYIDALRDEGQTV